MPKSPPGPFLTGSNKGIGGLRVDDGTVDVNGVNWITVSAGTLTDLGNGHVEITTGGGGGGSLTVQLADGSVVVGGVTDLQFNQADGFTLTDIGGGSALVGLGSHWYSIIVAGQTTLTVSYTHLTLPTKA